MSTSAWLIVGDVGHICGMVSSARKAADKVKMVIVGSEELSQLAAKSNPDHLVWYKAGEKIPAEALADEIADLIAKDPSEIILSLEDPVSRILWAKAAVKMDAAVVGTVFDVACEDGIKRAKRLIADDKSVKIVETKKVLAGIFNGDDTEPAAGEAEIVQAAADASSSKMRFAEGSEQIVTEKGGLKSAKRVVGVGYGVASKAELEMVKEFAAGIGAEVGCSLPVAKQLLWFEENRVVGITHNRIAPELYLALGVSGQPQHMSGVRDAKIVVGINTDPDAPIFQKCDYGVVGDVSKLLPVLLEKTRNQ